MTTSPDCRFSRLRRYSSGTRANSDADFVTGDFPGDLARLSPGVAQRLASAAPPVPADPDTEQYRLFEAFRTWLAAMAEALPVVLILDDLHWATGPTLLMLRHVLRDARLGRLLVLATYRDTDVDRHHPLSGILAELYRLAGVEHLQLEGLDEDGIELLLVAISEQSLDEELHALGRKLLAETNGNPFFVGEWLRHLAERGALVRRNDRWTVVPSLYETGLPQSIRDVLLWRLGRLDSATVEAMEVAAVIGRDFDLGLLIDVSGDEETPMLARLEQAVKAGLVTELGGDSHRFSHALVRGVLVDQLTEARRIRLHRRIAEELEGRAGVSPASLAHHWYEARSVGDRDKAIAASSAAGDTAMEQLAFMEAAEHFERALTLLEPTADTRVELLCDLSLRAAEAAAASGQYARERVTPISGVVTSRGFADSTT